MESTSTAFYSSTSPISVTEDANISTTIGVPSKLSIVKCAPFPNNDNYCDILIAVRTTSGCLSIIGSVFVLFLIWLFKKYLVFSQRIVLYLSMSALLDATGFVLGGVHPKGSICAFKGWWVTYFDWVVLSWVCCITFNLYLNVVKFTVKESLEKVYIAISWGVSFVISCLPFIGSQYGPAGAWCWIKHNTYWRVCFWYAPLFLVITILFFVYGYIIFTLRRKSSTWMGTYDPDRERAKETIKKDIKMLRAYPMIYLVLSIVPLINRIQNAISDDKPIFALTLIATLTSPLQGALNALVFSLDRDTLNRLTLDQIKTALHSRFKPTTILELEISHTDSPEIISNQNFESTEMQQRV